jgi:hypothetical protein
MSPFFARALGLALVAVSMGAPVSGQLWQNAYAASDSGNSLASVARVADGSFIGVGSFEGVGTLLNLNPTGSFNWGRSYGPVVPTAVRPTPGLGFAWIGNVPDPNHPIPVFVLNDFVGAVRASIQFSVPDTLRAEVTALEVDPHDGSFWVGGNAWLSDQVQEPWLAHLDGTGKVLWISAFQPSTQLATPQSIRIESLVPTSTSGVIAVGRWVYDDLWSGKNKMYAFRIDGQGKPIWSRAYAEKVTIAMNEQWFVHVTRDPLSPVPTVYAVAYADQICGLDRFLPCVNVFTGADLLALDEATGDVTWSTFIESGNHTIVFNPTSIARDDGNDLIAIGGSVDNGTAGFREAAMVRVRHMSAPSPSTTVLGAESYGDGTGPFVSEVADLSLLRVPSAPVTEPGFVLTDRQSTVALDRPSVVTTDANGHSDGKCERTIDLFPAPSIVAHLDIPLAPFVATSSAYTLLLGFEPLDTIPCSLIDSAVKARVKDKHAKKRARP